MSPQNNNSDFRIKTKTRTVVLCNKSEDSPAENIDNGWFLVECKIDRRVRRATKPEQMYE
jgi:hypothetical protein